MTKTKQGTSESLRDVLFNEIQELQKKKGNPQRALAVASLAKQIVSTVKVDLEFARLTLNNGAATNGTKAHAGKKSLAGGAARLTKGRSSATVHEGHA